MHSAVFKMDNPRDPQQSTAELRSALRGSLGGRELRAAWVCVAESLRCSPETLTTLLTGYIPTQNKKFLKRMCIRRKEASGSQLFLECSRHPIDFALKTI